MNLFMGDARSDRAGHGKDHFMAMAFIDLQAQRARIKDQIDAAIAGVLEDGRFVMGPPVEAFESALAGFGEARHALGCGNGTDALALALMAVGTGQGDAVFCPAFTFAATAEVAPWLGAQPVFVDINPDTFTMNPASLREAIEAVRKSGALTPRAIIAVDLFGQSADYPALRAIADKYGLRLIADSAQGFGCSLHGHQPLFWADLATVSFFPAKPLGCYGDGGAVLCKDDELAALIRSLRNHGMGADRYDNVRIGMNSRLDSLQAAILLEKLKIFPDEINRRNHIARRYSEALQDHVAKVPVVIEGGVSTWAQYTIEHNDRDGLAAHLRSCGVPSAIYYPLPLHRQKAYRDYGVAPGGLPVCEAKAARVLSLPMHAWLDEAAQDRVIDAVRGYNRG